MGISVKKKKNGKFILRHSFNDFQTEEMTKEEAIMYLYETKLIDVKLDFIKMFYSFPDGWGDGRERHSDKEGSDKYSNWHHKALETEDDSAYFSEINKKFDECMILINLNKG